MSEYLEVFVLGTNALISDFRQSIEQLRTFEWNKRAVLPVVYRSAAVRQFEALSVMIDAVKAGHAEVLIPALRPSFEELVWVRFLNTFDTVVAEEVCRIKLAIEMWDDLPAQLAQVGKNTMRQWGFSPAHLTKVEEGSRVAITRLKVIGTQLGWKKPYDRFPTMKSMAGIVDEKDAYSLIYHATSRTVHFSTAELLRRGWGAGSMVTISSSQLQEHWAAFLLCMAHDLRSELQ